ncbi:hypothetical protein CE489_17060 [Bacillus spizizenii]|nr:hypothetical protein CE489_17060 [Bacillus spizizenii]
MRLGKSVALNIKEKQTIKPTGFWTFFCNPKVWAIDDFLSSNQIEDTFSITSWQKEWFKESQQGIISVGHADIRYILMDVLHRFV